MSTPKIELSDGNKIPVQGLGVYKAGNDTDFVNLVQNAINRANINLIDTARYYGNEGSVGAAIHSLQTTPYIVTKVWFDCQNEQSVYRSVVESYWLIYGQFDGNNTSFTNSPEKAPLNPPIISRPIDLVLLHSPTGGNIISRWKGLIRAKKEGYVKSIGVSNFGKSLLEKLFNFCRKNQLETPVVNQIELSTFLPQTDIYNFCMENKVVLMAYSPLCRGEKMSDENLQKVSQNLSSLFKREITNAQVLCRWCIDKGIVVIPKSEKIHRIIENSTILDFEIDDKNMGILDEKCGVQNFRVCMDLTGIDEL